jgi:hypothetical protein
MTTPFRPGYTNPNLYFGDIMRFMFLLLALLSTNAFANQLEDFEFKVIGSCNDAQAVSFRKLQTVSTQQISTTLEGLPILIRSKLSLISNKTYVLNYSEYSVKKLKDGSYELKVLFSKDFSGNWEPTNYGNGQFNFLDQKNEVLFAGMPSIFTVNGRKTFQFVFFDNFERTASREKMVLLGSYTDTVGAFDEDGSVYCKNPY